MGDVSMLQGTSILGSSRVTSDEAEILHIPAAELRRALAEIPGVSKTIVDALIMRRRRLRRDQEFADLIRSHGFRMPLRVEQNEALDPIEVRFLGPQRVMLQTNNLSNAFEKFWLARVWSGG